MAKVAPQVLDDLTEARDWIPPAFITQFWVHMKPDVMILEFLLRLLRISNDATDYNGASNLSALDVSIVLSELLKENPPRHWGTCRNIEHLLEKLHIYNKELLAEIQALRKKLIDEMEAYSSPEYPSLDGWVVA